MRPELLTKQKLFINRMAENPEQAKWGFEILLKRQDFTDFFDGLIDAKLFSPEHNSGPVPAEDPGYVQIPYWGALDYLEAVAEHSGKYNDIPLAHKVMDIVRSASNFRDSDGNSRDNYHTYRKFAGILGLVPTAAIASDDLDLIPVWLGSKYDRGTVGHALDLGALQRLLASDSPDNWQKASTILNHCTAITWVEEEGFGGRRRRAVPAVEDYWLNELIKHHVCTFGAKAGRQAAQIFHDRICEVFRGEFSDLPTYLGRPAVEDHPQNHSWRGLVNSIVEGFRDVLLSWIDNKPDDASAFIAQILVDQNEMVRRVAIYVLAQRWSILKNLYGNIINPQLFDSRNIHELYNFLKVRFIGFSDLDKASTLQAINQLPPRLDHEDPKRLLKHTQRNWLSAIAGNGYEPADKWFKELEADQSLGKLSEHPDFHSYMETWSGHGPSPYTSHELLVFAENGSLIERLNDFQEPEALRGPSTKALVDSLAEAVGINPREFLRLLPAFLESKRPYQYGIISGFKRLWEVPRETQEGPEWNGAWEALIDFFEQLLGSPNFWTEEVVNNHDLTPTRDWIPPIIAEFLHAGTQNVDKSYSPELLPRTFSLITVLLKNLETADDTEDDAMFQAINSPRGKTIEALFSHTLRLCRISDAKCGGHSKAWEGVRPTFDGELAKCKSANYEFSTLAAAYLVNIDYMSRDWLNANTPKIFPTDFPNNFICAIDGLAYCTATRTIYALLIEHDVLVTALRSQLIHRQARERLIERIALAYLWGDAQLDSPPFDYLFKSSQFEDLQDTSRFFYSVRGQELKEEHIERILSFWERCVDCAKALPEPPIPLLSELSQLICYVKNLSEREYSLLLAVAEHVAVGYHADTFIEELHRLVEQHPSRISSVLEKILDAYKPDYDHEDHLKNLLIKLARSARRDDALRYTNLLRKLPGMNQLFRQLSDGQI